jgi:hypothetical protein
MPDDVVDSGSGSELADDLAILNDESSENKVETDDIVDDASETLPEPESDEEEIEEPIEEGEEKASRDAEKEAEEVEKLDLRGKELVAKINKISPKLLKEAPELRGVIFRDHEYAKLFPTVEDAKEGASRLRSMDQFESSLMAGDSNLVLSALSQTDPNAYAKFAQNFLPTLFKGDKQTYVKVTLPLVKNILRSAMADGTRMGGDFGKNLANAGKIISKHLFDSYEVPEDARPTQNSEQQKFEQERRNFYQARYQEFDTGTKVAALTKFEGDVKESLKTYRLTEFVRDALVHKIIKETNETLGKDANHVALMNSLWARAKKSGLSDATKSQIISAYLGRVKTVMPSVRARLLREALTGKSGNGNPNPKNRITPSRTTQESKVVTGRNVDPRSIDYRRTSDMDILNGKVTLRKGR